MQYSGAKSKVARELASIISAFEPKIYWEPFCGAGNVIQLVNAPRKIGSDLDVHIVSYLSQLQTGWLPPARVTKDDYSFWRCNEPKTFEEMALRAAVGYGASFGGKWFGGYAYGPHTRIGCVRRASEKQAPMLKGIEFKSQSYLEGPPDGCDLIYCDPPYRGTTSCGASKRFNSDVFWAWCLLMKSKGIRVLVTEFSAPDFAIEIWSKEKFTDLRRSDGQTVMTERLFLVGGL
jgi:DNA adenine methylase